MTGVQTCALPIWIVRLSVDEEVFARHGRYGIDYHESEYHEKESPVVAGVYRRLQGLMAAGRDVVLVYFDVGRAELLRRLTDRNRRRDANALRVTPEALQDFIARFEAPSGEGEEFFVRAEQLDGEAVVGDELEFSIDRSDTGWQLFLD